MVGANGSIGRADPGLTTCPPAWRAAIRHNVNDHGSFLLWIGHTYEISRGRGDLSFVRHIRAVPRDRYCGAGLGGAAIRRMEDFMPTIAIVDDDRNILTSVSTALEIEGYRIMTYRMVARPSKDSTRIRQISRSWISRCRHGRLGDVAPASREVQIASDLSVLQGRGNR